ncbi:response regulator [Flavobacterium tistrianum]|uniref:response regulator n=1 Tax=Flavobacterium tistrianum TaxID=1685414 RepID=UPI001EF3E0C4|nr:response regulator [Flavobacterium tistrianum]
MLKTLCDLKEKLPDIVFLDINMPGKSGFDCLKEIRVAAHYFRNIKVVVLSTSANQLNISHSY